RDDVLQRGADLDADNVIRGVQPESGAAKLVLHGFHRQWIRGRRDQRGRKVPRHFSRETRTGQRDDGMTPARLVPNDFGHSLERAFFNSLRRTHQHGAPRDRGRGCVHRRSETVRGDRNDDVTGASQRLVERRHRFQLRWKCDVGQVRRIRAAVAHLLDERAVAPPERDRVPGARKMDRQRRTPASRAKYCRLVSRVRTHPDNSTVSGQSRPGRASSARLSNSSAAMTDCCRTIARSPTKRYVRTRAGPAATATTTVPTGFSADPPSGPAIPVIARPAFEPRRSRTPSAIATATGSLTAPCFSMRSAATPSWWIFTSFAYAIT